MNCKKLIALVCLFLFSSIVINNDLAHASNKPISTVVAKDVNSEKYVSNDGDLILRDAANSKGKKVTMLKKGSKVFVYSTDENGWSYVKQGKFKGYTQDAYLVSKKQPTSKNSTSKKRVIDFSMNINQVKNMEPAKLNQEIKEDDITVLKYEVEKYGYYSVLSYFFVSGKLDIILYDFLPEKSSYNSWDEMSVMFDRLDKKAIKEFGNGTFTGDDGLGYNSWGRLWYKEDYTIALYVDDDNIYTQAKLAIHKN
ncbi:SH3 domain-containing protein [Solibacillus silvestris]